MPTKRSRRPQLVRTPFTSALRRFLESGDYGGGEGSHLDFKIFDLAGAVLHGEYDEIRARWAEHGAGLLADWIREHPGTRPFAWWILEATEPRRVLEGAAHVLPAGPAWWEPDWRGHFGVPAVEQSGRFVVVVESEPAYLERLGLLARGERRRLAAENFAPEKVEVDVAPPLEQLRREHRERWAMVGAKNNGHGG
jgi:hypothetical protein